MVIVKHTLSKENPHMSTTSLPTPDGRPVPGPHPTGSPSTPPRTRRWAAAGLTGGLLAGTAAGLIMGVPGVSSAATATAPTAAVQQTDTGDTVSDTDSTTDERPEPGARLREALDPLVTDGTINSEQADAVAAHLAESRPDRPGRHGPRDRFAKVSDATTELLGLEPDELFEQLRDGNSLADIAEAQDVDVDVLVQALVDEAEAHVNDAVEDGKLSADEAAERLETLEERVTARVNGERPERPEGAGGQFGRRGPGGQGG